MLKALFVGCYPNKIDPYLRSFYCELIHAIADMGIECTVVAPVSITHYRNKISLIDKHEFDITNKGSRIEVFHPRYISYSSKNVGPFKTGYLSEKAFQNAALNCVKKIDKKFDFVYGHFFLTGGLAAIRIGKKLKLPSFVAFGECDYESQIRDDYGELKHRDIKGITGIISVSTKNKQVLDSLGLFKDVPIILAPNSVDLAKFKKMDKMTCRHRLNLPNEKFIVGFVGGFIERKGDKRLLEAVNQLDDTYVAFAGRGEDKPSGDRVVFCQAMEHNDIPIFLNAVDVFVLPTLAEGSCNAIVEAMACGLPIISSDLPFNDDVLDNENSIRIDPMSVDEIRDAISTLKDENKREMMGENALLTAQNLSIERRAARILDFIERYSDKHDSK